MKDDDMAAGAEIIAQKLAKMNKIYTMAVSAVFERKVRFFGRLAL
ncbi:MAG: hypothetical protein ABR568_05725 [Pyrinomonadaceae bacterium]